MQSDLGAVDEARWSLKAAIAAYQAEVARSPQDIALRTGLADAWLALGGVDLNFGEQDKGRQMLTAWQTNAELREGLARGRPDDPDLQRDLAEALDLLASVQDGAGREAISTRLRGAEIRFALFLNSPDEPKFNAALGETMNNIAVLLGEIGLRRGRPGYVPAQQGLLPFRLR